MRRKAAHSMMLGAPSTHPPEGSPRPTTPPCRQKGSSTASPYLRKLRGRTSRLEPPASDPRQTRSACNGKQHQQPCRSSHGHKREGQTTGAIDKKAHECQSRGCSQTFLYNTVRPHGRLGRLPPAVFGATRRPEEQRGGTLRSIGGFAPRPVARPSERAKEEQTQSADV